MMRAVLNVLEIVHKVIKGVAVIEGLLAQSLVHGREPSRVVGLAVDHSRRAKGAEADLVGEGRI